MNFEQWKQYAGNPHTEKRGNRIAVCTHGLLVNVASMLFDLSDFSVWAVCGPYTEIIPRSNAIPAN